MPIPGGIGKLRNYVTVKRPVAATGDDTLTTIVSCFCRIEPMGGKALEIATLRESTSNVFITFRHTVDVQTADFIERVGGERYFVDSVTEEINQWKRAECTTHHAA